MSAQEPDDPPPGAKQRPVLRPQAHGGALYAGGVPGNRGGRPSNEFREFLAELLGSSKLRESLRQIAEMNLPEIASRRAHEAVRAAHLLLDFASWAADRVEGRATLPVVVDSEGSRRQALRAMTDVQLVALLATLNAEQAEAEQEPELLGGGENGPV